MFHVLHLARSTRCWLRILQNINRKTVNFEQQILALLLVHLTNNLSCIKYAHLSQQVQGLCILSSSIQAHHMKPSILRQMQSWFQMEKTTGAAIGYNVRVANNNLRYNLRLPWRKKKRKKKTNSSQFITRIASHPRNKRESNCLPSSGSKKTEKIDHFEEVIHPKQREKRAFHS